jgi:ferrous iron transport protein A
VSDKKLSQVGVGFKGKVVKVNELGEELGASLLRLRELGVFEGSHIEVEHQAVLGDPIIINVRGTKVALRKVDADAVVVSGE